MKKLRKAFTAIVLVICMSVLMVSPAFAEEPTDTFVIPEGQELISRTVTDLGDGYTLTQTVTATPLESNPFQARNIPWEEAPTRTVTNNHEITLGQQVRYKIIMTTKFWYTTETNMTGVVDNQVTTWSQHPDYPMTYEGSEETSGKDWGVGQKHWTRMTATGKTKNFDQTNNYYTAWTQIYSDGNVYTG